MMRASSRALVLVTAGLIALTGCTPELPTVQVDPPPAAPAPVLTVAQDEAVYTAVGEALAAASEALDPAALDARLAGPALAIRTAELQVAAATGKTDDLVEIPTTVQSQFLPTTQTWPRTTFAVSDRPQNLQSERLLVTEQAGPRDLYKLWAWVRLFPGVTLPTFPSADIGTEAVAPDDTSLVMTPADAVAHYADVLTSGDGSAFVAEFADDPLRQQVAARRANRDEKATIIEGTFTLAFTAAPDGLRALRTADGGALVVGQISSTETLQGKEGALIPPPETEKTFVGDAAPTNSLTTGRTGVVAIYVPPAGSDQPMSVLGSELVTTSASIP